MGRTVSVGDWIDILEGPIRRVHVRIHRGISPMGRVAKAGWCAFLILFACSKKAELNSDLMAAVKTGNATVVNELLGRGADANAREETDLGRSALGIAAEEDYGEIVSLLIANGADVNAKSLDGLTALMYAAGEGNTGIVNLLLSSGAMINTVDNTGQTPLIKAAGDGHDIVVTALISRGADIHTRDGAGHTAVMKAMINGHTEMARLLQGKGARLTEDDRTIIMESARLNAQGEEIDDIDEK